SASRITALYTLPLHDALPIYRLGGGRGHFAASGDFVRGRALYGSGGGTDRPCAVRGRKPHRQSTARVDEVQSRQGRARWFRPMADRKSTRLNSSHVKISYAVF